MGNILAKIKYIYWRLRRVTCKDCVYYYLNPKGCDFYGNFNDIEICHSSFTPFRRENRT